MSKQEKLISADKMLEHLKSVDLMSTVGRYGQATFTFQELDQLIKKGLYDPDPVPTIKPGDRVNHYGFQFPFLKGVKVNHLQIHRFGTYAVLEHDGETYTVPFDSLEIVKDE
ncbi:hypothetical protein [Paenibacillus sp. Marseille-Q4541]|uniref:hypothetical protein n=1 Tax=Paenibacillus sp. Marseille-Q4541 TaxID=2831522 RepID=UPI001BAE3F4A|nr:hypothetical protein [Paenibacillus sp. Marseille-Q4541]